MKYFFCCFWHLAYSCLCWECIRKDNLWNFSRCYQYSQSSLRCSAL